MQKNVMVICGGKSAEHDVSIITAVQFLEKLDKSIYKVNFVYISRENEMFVGDELMQFSSYRKFDAKKHKKAVFLPNDKHLYLLRKNKLVKKEEIEFAFNCCHGGIGENGILSGMLFLSGISCSCPIASSLGLAMDKVLSKNVLASNGIDVIEDRVVFACDWQNNRDEVLKNISELGYPIIVKPARQGSSVGVVLAENERELINAARIAFVYDSKLLVEKAIVSKREFNCSCLLGSELFVSEIEEPETNGVILSFEQKYSSGGKSGKTSASKLRGGNKLAPSMVSLERKLPTDIPEELKKKIQETSKKCFEIFELSGVVRIDFIFDNTCKKLYLSEVNSIPGSMAYYFWKNIDIAKEIEVGARKYYNTRFNYKTENDVKLL